MQLAFFAALRARDFAFRRSLGRLRGARVVPGRRVLFDICRPSGAAFRRPVKFGTPARRAARWGRLWGCAPLASPPKHPLKKVFSFPKPARATRLLLRELPSLAPLSQVISLRAALCQIQLSLWILFRFSQILTETCSLKKCLCIVPAPKNSP